MGRKPNNPRKPLLTQRVIDSLGELLTTMTPDQMLTDAGKYLYDLHKFCSSEEYKTRKEEISAKVQQSKRKRDPEIGTRKRVWEREP